MEFHNHHLNHDMSLYGGGGGGGGGRDPSSNGEGGRPTWLSSAILRQQTPYDVDGNFLHLQTRENNASGQWLPRPHPTSQILRQTASVSAEIQTVEGDVGEREGGRGGGSKEEDGRTWQNARYKAEIVAHPLFEQLLSAHVACLRVATPVDQIPKIDAQLSQSQSVFARYSVLGGGTTGMPTMLGDDKELEQLLTHYVLLLCSFKEQLQQHVRVHAMEAVMACWEIEQSLQTLTGISPGEGTGATMSDDEDEPFDTEGGNFYEGNVDGTDSMGFGPLIPTESERSLMERVRQELKHELKQGYKDKIVDIREEILRKRRAGKLPGDTTLLLKAWWQSHSKWPYPTEDDKARLVQETGLQLKQINNWFINQRKRNWHTNPSSSNLLKSKRKRL